MALALRGRINNTGGMSYSQFNEATRAIGNVLRDSDGTTWAIPSLGLSGVGADLNDVGELAWRGIVDSSQTDIMMLRRIAPNGDFNHDCRINAYDYAILENCYTGDGNGPVGGLLADCTRADFDGDGDVDQADVDAFIAVVTGVEGMVDGCEP